MPRNRAIDAVKGFAILIVMLGHCIVLNGLDASDPYLYDAIKAVQMPLFMAVSGALAGMSYARKGRVRLSSLKRRAQSYLIPFFSWFVVVFVVTHCIDGTIGVGLFFKELVQLLFETDRGLWFLTTLFFVTLVVTLAQYAADLLAGRAPAWVRGCLFLLLVLFGYGLFFLQARSGFLLFSPSLAVQYMPFYVLYYLFFAYREKVLLLLGGGEKGKKWLRFCLTVACIICFGSFDVCVILRDLAAPPQGMAELFWGMAASLMGSYVCFFCVYRLYERSEKKERGEEGRGLRFGDFLPWVGQYTLEIYVLHFRFARLLPRPESALLYSARGIGYLAAVFVLMSLCTAVSIFVLKKIRVADMLLFGKFPSVTNLEDLKNK